MPSLCEKSALFIANPDFTYSTRPYIFLFYLAVYVLRHLNYVKCPSLSFIRIYFFGGGGGYYLDFFYKNTFFFIANADFTYLAIYYNLIIKVMSCDIYVMLNIHVS